MDKIASFQIDHTKLIPGVYVSRKDKVGNVILTTFDLRFVKPNSDSILDTGTCHTIEHLGATFLRNHKKWKNKTIYFGPMGCRTGFYLILRGNLFPFHIRKILKEMCEFVMHYEGDIPGASEKECGNYKDQNLKGAKEITQTFYKDVILHYNYHRTHYPK